MSIFGGKNTPIRCWEPLASQMWKEASTGQLRLYGVQPAYLTLGSDAYGLKLGAAGRAVGIEVVFYPLVQVAASNSLSRSFSTARTVV